MTRAFSLLNTHLFEMLGIQKLFKIVRYLDKKHTKKLLSFFSLVACINQTIFNRRFVFFCFVKLNLVAFLYLLKRLHFLFDFYVIPQKLIGAVGALTGLPILLTDLVLGYLNDEASMFISGFCIKYFSTPKRPVYLSFKGLRILCRVSNLGRRQFVLHTTCGLLTHTEALKQGLGGKLLCII
jgi:ribosomal protein S8